MHIPEPRLHAVRYYGEYACRRTGLASGRGRWGRDEQSSKPGLGKLQLIIHRRAATTPAGTTTKFYVGGIFEREVTAASP